MQALKCEPECLKSVGVEKKMAWMRAGDSMQPGALSSPAGAVAWSGVHTAGAGERMAKGSSHTHGPAWWMAAYLQKQYIWQECLGFLCWKRAFSTSC